VLYDHFKVKTEAPLPGMNSLHSDKKTGAFYNSSCWEAKSPSLFWLKAVSQWPNLNGLANMCA
jgi:hypothetical protein